MIIEHYAQYSEAWWKDRIGAITMSHAKKLLTGGKGITRRNYILDVASERLSGIPVERPSTYDMQRGLELEPFAIGAYERATGLVVKRIGTVWRDGSKTVGGSLDGVVSGKIGLEAKCPRPRAHMKWITDPDGNGHAEQMQGYMWLMDIESFDFVSFCPEFTALPLFIHTVHRDEEVIANLVRSVDAAIEEIDEIVDEVRDLADPATNLRIESLREDAISHLDTMLGPTEVSFDE